MEETSETCRGEQTFRQVWVVQGCALLQERHVKTCCWMLRRSCSKSERSHYTAARQCLTCLRGGMFELLHPGSADTTQYNSKMRLSECLHLVLLPQRSVSRPIHGWRAVVLTGWPPCCLTDKCHVTLARHHTHTLIRVSHWPSHFYTLSWKWATISHINLTLSYHCPSSDMCCLA